MAKILFFSRRIILSRRRRRGGGKVGVGLLRKRQKRGEWVKQFLENSSGMGIERRRRPRPG